MNFPKNCISIYPSIGGYLLINTLCSTFISSIFNLACCINVISDYNKNSKAKK